MKILAFHNIHDSNLSAIEDGDIKLHLEYERLFNRKNLSHWQHVRKGGEDLIPFAIDQSLKFLDWSINDVNWLVFTSTVLDRNVVNIFKKTTFKEVEQTVPKNLPHKQWTCDWSGAEMNCLVVNHHVSHLALAYYTSPFDDALLFAYDGEGDYGVNTMSAIGENGRIKHYENHYDNSIGFVYSNVGYLFPFIEKNMLTAAGKAMGLSSYGKPNDKWRQVVRDKIRWNSSPQYFMWHQMEEVRTELGLEVKDLKNPESQVTRDLMATIQDEAELYVIEKIRDLVKKTGKRNLCMAGGCALNVQINTRLLEEGIVDNLHIPPACSDTGLSSGAGLYLWHEALENEFSGTQWHSPYLGLPAKNKELLDEKHDDIEIKQMGWNDLLNETVKRLQMEQILGWCQGRAEIGPRALGNRSILANCGKSEMKDIINSRVKHREYWRPFAHICLEEDVSDWFEIDHPQPYMLESPKAKEDKKHLIPAVVHVDDTARVQSVNMMQNFKAHSLLTRFKEKTGVPVLLNTSLNDRGFPICNDVQVIFDLLRTDQLDFAVIDNYMVWKK